MRRLGAIVVGIAAGLGLLLTVPGFAADANPADAMLDRARDALRTQEFSGRVRLEWWDGSDHRAATVPVSTAHGVLQVDKGRVIEQRGRAWIRGAHRWITLWGDDRDPKAPSIAAKYRTQVHAGPRVAGRPTRELVVRHDDHVVERIAVDRTYGFVLARERYDDSGRSEPRCISCHCAPSAHGRLSHRSRQWAPVRRRRCVCRPTRTGAWATVSCWSRLDGSTRTSSSCGTATASSMSRSSRAGDLDWGSLPAGGRTVEWGGVKARRYMTAAGSVVVWQAGDRTLTCVTDAPRTDQSAIVAELTGGVDSGWSDVFHFVIAPFGWT